MKLGAVCWQRQFDNISLMTYLTFKTKSPILGRINFHLPKKAPLRFVIYDQTGLRLIPDIRRKSFSSLNAISDLLVNVVHVDGPFAVAPCRAQVHVVVFEVFDASGQSLLGGPHLGDLLATSLHVGQHQPKKYQREE
jgi:hypothetical protein